MVVHNLISFVLFMCKMVWILAEQTIFMDSRPQLPKEITETPSSEAELFQNAVLRPIIKMQSDLLMAHIQARITSMKMDWNRLKPMQKKEALNTLLTKDQGFKNEIIGMVIGHFSLEEYQEYKSMQKELNRRITQIVLNRSIDKLV
jgi:hypothetical protein